MEMSTFAKFLAAYDLAIGDCIKALEQHRVERSVLIDTRIDESQRVIAIRECIAVLELMLEEERA